MVNPLCVNILARLVLKICGGVSHYAVLSIYMQTERVDNSFETLTMAARKIFNYFFFCRKKGGGGQSSAVGVLW